MYLRASVLAKATRKMQTVVLKNILLMNCFATSVRGTGRLVVRGRLIAQFVGRDSRPITLHVVIKEILFFILKRRTTSSTRALAPACLRWDFPRTRRSSWHLFILKCVLIKTTGLVSVAWTLVYMLLYTLFMRYTVYASRARSIYFNAPVIISGK